LHFSCCSDRLLDLLSYILSGQPYKPLGAPQSLGRPDVAAMTRDMNVSQVMFYEHIRKVKSVTNNRVSQATADGKDNALITLALSTLGSFDFSGRTNSRTIHLFISETYFAGHVLNEFVRNCALPYLEDDNTDVRREAAFTCCRLFVRDPICYQASSHAIEIISDVLDKLLTVGIADPGNHDPCTLCCRQLTAATCRSQYPTCCSIFASRAL
jgi:serine/threonine-protein kinase mTOR